MKKYILILTMLTLNSWAQLLPAAKFNPTLKPQLILQRVPLEAWIKMTCVGQTTPENSWPLKVSTIATFHTKVNVNAPYPDMQELRNSRSDFFKNITKYCTEKRWNMMDLSQFPSTSLWLDWGTDTGYAKLILGEEFIYDNSCRAANKPCESNAQCCGFNSRFTGLSTNFCNMKTNTCESNLIQVTTKKSNPQQ
ncbi:MAG: hypothetical protein ACOYL6_11455 [Bacteriovoracaceae bacterium]